MKRKALYFASVVILACICVYVFGERKSFDAAAAEFYQEYLEECKNGYDKAVDYVYFDNDWEAEYFTANTMNYLVEYRILEDAREINDSLVVFKVELESAADKALGQTVVAYNFVAEIDDEYRVITNARNVPITHRENFNEDQYSNSQEDTDISVDEVL